MKLFKLPENTSAIYNVDILDNQNDNECDPHEEATNIPEKPQNASKNKKTIWTKIANHPLGKKISNLPWNKYVAFMGITAADNKCEDDALIQYESPNSAVCDNIPLRRCEHAVIIPHCHSENEHNCRHNRKEFYECYRKRHHKHHRRRRSSKIDEPDSEYDEHDSENDELDDRKKSKKRRRSHERSPKKEHRKTSPKSPKPRNEHKSYLVHPQNYTKDRYKHRAKGHRKKENRPRQRSNEYSESGAESYYNDYSVNHMYKLDTKNPYQSLQFSRNSNENLLSFNRCKKKEHSKRLDPNDSLSSHESSEINCLHQTQPYCYTFAMNNNSPYYNTQTCYTQSSQTPTGRNEQCNSCSKTITTASSESDSTSLPKMFIISQKAYTESTESATFLRKSTFTKIARALQRKKGKKDPKICVRNSCPIYGIQQNKCSRLPQNVTTKRQNIQKPSKVCDCLKASPKESVKESSCICKNPMQYNPELKQRSCQKKNSGKSDTITIVDTRKMDQSATKSSKDEVALQKPKTTESFTNYSSEREIVSHRNRSGSTTSTASKKSKSRSGSTTSVASKKKKSQSDSPTSVASKKRKSRSGSTTNKKGQNSRRNSNAESIQSKNSRAAGLTTKDEESEGQKSKRNSKDESIESKNPKGARPTTKDEEKPNLSSTTAETQTVNQYICNSGFQERLHLPFPTELCSKGGRKKLPFITWHSAPSVTKSKPTEVCRYAKQRTCGRYSCTETTFSTSSSSVSTGSEDSSSSRYAKSRRHTERGDGKTQKERDGPRQSARTKRPKSSSSSSSSKRRRKKSRRKRTRHDHEKNKKCSSSSYETSTSSYSSSDRKPSKTQKNKPTSKRSNKSGSKRDKQSQGKSAKSRKNGETSTQKPETKRSPKSVDKNKSGPRKKKAQSSKRKKDKEDTSSSSKSVDENKSGPRKKKAQSSKRKKDKEDTSSSSKSVDENKSGPRKKKAQSGKRKKDRGDTSRSSSSSQSSRRSNNKQKEHKSRRSSCHSCTCEHENESSSVKKKSQRDKRKKEYRAKNITSTCSCTSPSSRTSNEQQKEQKSRRLHHQDENKSGSQERKSHGGKMKKENRANMDSSSSSCTSQSSRSCNNKQKSRIGRYNSCTCVDENKSTPRERKSQSGKRKKDTRAVNDTSTSSSTPQSSRRGNQKQHNIQNEEKTKRNRVNPRVSEDENENGSRKKKSQSGIMKKKNRDNRDSSSCSCTSQSSRSGNNNQKKQKLRRMRFNSRISIKHKSEDENESGSHKKNHKRRFFKFRNSTRCSCTSLSTRRCTKIKKHNRPSCLSLELSSSDLSLENENPPSMSTENKYTSATSTNVGSTSTLNSGKKNYPKKSQARPKKSKKVNGKAGAKRTARNSGWEQPEQGGTVVSFVSISSRCTIFSSDDTESFFYVATDDQIITDDPKMVEESNTKSAVQPKYVQQQTAGEHTRKCCSENGIGNKVSGHCSYHACKCGQILKVQVKKKK